MVTLTPQEIDEVGEFLARLVGFHLLEMWRYDGYQAFSFGQPPQTTESLERRVVVPDRFSVGSWNFGRRGKRFDDYAPPFDEGLGTGPGGTELSHP